MSRKVQGPPAWPADQVERRAVADLNPYEGNPRTHDARQISEIIGSIEQWGWTVPVLVDEGDVIIAGHGRVMAAIEMGLDEVPVVVARGWSDAQKRAYVIADNQLALHGGWDEALLRAELGTLQGEGFNLDLIGFTEGDLTALFLPHEDGENDPAAEWQGMPEYEQGDQTAFRSIVVHFKDQEAVDDFARTIAQVIAPKARYLWFPQGRREVFDDQRYAANGAPVADLHSVQEPG